ncbi:hypothetical protein Q3G72_023338 [Acer saccharum]|nr:hypothetical protein Q3G72_023338 [Acer saccharum]
MATSLVKIFQSLLCKEHDNEPEVLKEQTLVLLFNKNRKGCARNVKKFITKWKGVTSVNIDETKGWATVQGNFDEKKLVKGLWNARIAVKIVSSDNPDTCNSTMDAIYN